jgi:parallel beta-helix repeat protein
MLRSTSNNGSGIFGGASNSSIMGNFIYKNNGSGIVLLNSFDNAISVSQANDNKDAGIMLIFGSNNIISDSIFNNNVNSGISLLFSWKNELAYNIVNGNLVGIYLGNSSEGNLVNRNDVSYNLLGIHLDSSNNNTICQNNILKNDHSAFDDGINQWDLNENGNYYSDFDCSDSNADGICDKYRSIPGGISSDRYPLASFLKQQNS